MATINASLVPATVTITNSSATVRNVQLYRVNTSVVLTPGSELVLKVDNSSELIFFLSQATEDGIEVVSVPVEA